MVITDSENIFMPQPEELLVDLADSYDLIINLLDNMPNYFKHTHSPDSCFIAAL